MSGGANDGMRRGRGRSVWHRIIARQSFLETLVVWLFVMFVLCVGLTILLFLNEAPSMRGALVAMGILWVIGSVLGVMAFACAKAAVGILGDLSDALHKVAGGDFSVRLRPRLRLSKVSALIYRDFNNMANQLEQTKILNKRFIANFSHEFKTPINSINGFARLILETEIPLEDERRYLGLIAEESERLARLSANALLLSRLDAREGVGEQASFSLDEQLRQCVLLLERQWVQKGIEVSVDLESVTLTSNEPLLKEVWLNLLGNAIKFTPEGGSIDVRMWRGGECAGHDGGAGGGVADDGMVFVAVGDTGAGMTSEQANHVFERFYQADESHAMQGNGLGLAIAQRIVELAGGDVGVESELGEGSTFTVRLPLAPGE